MLIWLPPNIVIYINIKPNLNIFSKILGWFQIFLILHIYIYIFSFVLYFPCQQNQLCWIYFQTHTYWIFSPWTPYYSPRANITYSKNFLPVKNILGLWLEKFNTIKNRDCKDKKIYIYALYTMSWSNDLTFSSKQYCIYTIIKVNLNTRF